MPIVKDWTFWSVKVKSRGVKRKVKTAVAKMRRKKKREIVILKRFQHLRKQKQHHRNQHRRNQHHRNQCRRNQHHRKRHLRNQHHRNPLRKRVRQKKVAK
uniref:Uncharacterized protein n=1 Tax=Cacopsylla melanoneura TaxID=428564 RepID=A0A8D8WGW4_9HEMI